MNRIKHSIFDDQRIAATVFDILFNVILHKKVILQRIGDITGESLGAILLAKPLNLDGGFGYGPINQPRGFAVSPGARQPHAGLTHHFSGLTHHFFLRF
jgi:hypothetical protein